MATASHERVANLSSSLSKSHHVPIQDLWGLSLNNQNSNNNTNNSKLNKSDDYALEIARDISRGPLMSSASSAPFHDINIDDTVGIIEASAGSSTSISTPSSSSGKSTPPSASPSLLADSKQNSVDSIPSSKPTGLWNHQSTSHSPPGAKSTGGLLKLTPKASQAFLGSTSLGSNSLNANPLSAPLKAPLAGTAPPGMGHVVVPQVASAASVSQVNSIGQFSSGIWGPRQNFSTFSATPTASVYGKTPWAPEHHSTLVTKSSTPSQQPSSQGQRIYPYGLETPVVPVPSVQQTPVLPATTAPVSVPVATTPQAASVAPIAPTGHGVSHSKGHHNNHGHHGHHGSHHGSHHDRNQKKNGRPSTNTELYKTELCASFMSTGGNCPYGEKCQFAHGPQELKSVDRPPKWRSKPCQNWVKTGTCSYNERCCFRHDVPVHNTQ